MNTPTRLLVTLLSMTFLFALLSPARAQDSSEDIRAEIYVAINQSIIDSGARPLGRSDTLDVVAQTIADELSVSGTYTSLPRALADENGYPRWSDGGQRVITDAINYIGVDDPQAFAAMRQEDILDTLQNTFYREMGIGYATYQAVAQGTVQNVYVVVMGAQPNVLPVVVENGADTVYTRDVLLYVHNELSLAYETDPDVIQQAETIRVASSESELSDAEPLAWEGNNFGLPWMLTEDFGEKEVWVEFEDEKGVTVQSSVTVEYADPATAPVDVAPPAPGITLNLSYGDDTFTLAVDSERDTVRLQEVYFQWEIDGFTRAYELENPEALQSVNLEDFSSADCIQIRWAGVQSVVNVDGCAQTFLEARRFSELSSAFWTRAGGSFEVWDGPRLLGECTNSAGSCTITLR